MWLDFSSNGIHRELEMRRRRRWTQISHLASLEVGLLRKQEEEEGRGKTLSKGSSHSLILLEPNGEEGDGLVFL